MEKSRIRRILAALAILSVLMLTQMQNVLASSGWPLSAVEPTKEYTGHGVRIAIIDTGISAKHLGETQLQEGKNYVFPETGTDDLIGHGTRIAGILLGSEEMGLSGVAPDAELIPLVYYSRYPSGVTANGGVEAIAQAIYDAIDVYGCRIINISSGTSEPSALLEDAVSYAEKKGVLVVAAAGNDGFSASDTVYFPAAYGTVAAVGAADENGLTASFSQKNGSVMLLAPGTGIPAVTAKNGIAPETVSGSSYAAAYVSGAAACLLECNSGLTAAQLRELLSSTAVDVGEAGVDEESGWGLLNIAAAVDAAEKP